LRWGGLDLERKEPTPAETEAVVEHQEVLKEEAAVETVRALEDRYIYIYTAFRNSKQNTC
jgi:hypothetical protein